MFNLKAVEAPKASVSKMFNPGSIVGKITNFTIQPWATNAERFRIMVTVEGPEIEGFEGMFIDYQNQALGRYKGQFVRVELPAYVKNTDDSSERDRKIMQAVVEFADQLGFRDELNEKGEKADSLEALGQIIAGILAEKGEEYHFTVGATEVENNGFKNYKYHSFPFADRRNGLYPYALTLETLLPFDADKHIKKDTPAPAVADFAVSDDDAPFPMGI